MANLQLSGSPGGGEFATEQESKLPFGFLAYFGAGVSIFFCYFQILVDLIAPLFGATAFAINPHAQALFMWVFGALTVFGLYRDHRVHGDRGPLCLGLAGLLVIAATLYTFYDVRILIFGYLLLVAAALLNPAKLLQSLNRSVGRQAQELAQLNSTLETRVEGQVAEIERLARLKQFLSAEVADIITEEGKESLLDSHRQVIACLFCDVRNFTSFSEAVEPEDVMNVLQNVHQTMGQLVADHGGTIGYRAGDGLMVIFNDPLPCDAPVLKAAELARAMTRSFGEVRERWEQLGHGLGLGIGIAYGYATLGVIGSEGRYDYTAIGKVVNIAARLCDRAADGETLLDTRAFMEVEGKINAENVGTLELKGLQKPVEVYRLSA